MAKVSGGPIFDRCRKIACEQCLHLFVQALIKEHRPCTAGQETGKWGPIL